MPAEAGKTKIIYIILGEQSHFHHYFVFGFDLGQN
jgi:hypothetical protein